MFVSTLILQQKLLAEQILVVLVDGLELMDTKIIQMIGYEYG